YRLEPNSVEAETPVDVVSQRYPLEACWISMTAPMPLSEVHILWWNPVIRRADAEAVGWETSSSIRAALHLAFCKDLHIGKPTWAVLIAILRCLGFRRPLGYVLLDEPEAWFPHSQVTA